MNQPTDASAMFAPIWRRKWLILIVAVLVAIGTYLYYRHEARPSYQATTQIYLGAGAEEQTQIGGIGVTTTKKSGALEPAAQATLINSSIIKGAVREQLRKQRKTKVVRAALVGKTKAKASEKSEFITLTAEAHSARGTALLANLTAQTYVNRENRKYHRAVEAAIALTRRQLRRIETSAAVRSSEASAAAAKGSKSSSKSSAPSAAETLQATNLASKINELEADLGIVSVRQLNPVKPKSVVKISSSPKQNAIFGFAVGLLLAALIVFALARLDHRLRSLGEIEAAFETEILTALRAVRRPVVLEDGSPPRPARTLRDGLQRLHTGLQVGRANGQEDRSRPRTILCVSADPGDGVSTVLADLALTQSEAGEAVAVVEANLRRPVLAKLLGVSGREGLADVLEGKLGVREAIQGVGASSPPVGSEQPVVSDGATATVVEAPSTGSASLLTAGTAAANPPALLAGEAMGETLRTLAEDFDYVLIDAPAALEVSDVIPLLGLVDGVVIVARVGQTREISARRLVQLLARTPSAPVLGVVANGASQQDINRFGFSAYGARNWRSRLSRL
jgi:Mrp family chromosome partitioning ATPase/capsular polysaccharide biosynthesis protein